MYTNKEIWNVSYPIFLGLLAQNIINVTDTAFLGRVGEVELGASAMGGLFYICVFTIAFGFSVGSQILIARRNGEGRYKDVGPCDDTGRDILAGAGGAHVWADTSVGPIHCPLCSFHLIPFLMLPWNFSTGVFGAFSSPLST